MIRRTVTLFSLLVVASVVLAEDVPLFPSMTPEQLANAVAKSQLRYEKYRTRYRLTYGTVVNADGFTGEFVPQEPSYSVDGDWGVDHSKGMAYLREDMFGTDKRTHYLTEAAFDGHMGSELRQGGPGSTEWFGAVCKGLPKTIDPLSGVHHPRPEDALFWHIDGTDLASVLRKADECKIQTCWINGFKCYRVTLRLAREKTVLIPGREEEVRAQERRLVRVYLAPEMNMLPVSIDHLRTEAADDMDGEVKERWVLWDFREVSENLWFPHRARRYVARAKSDPVAIDMTLWSVRVGESAEIPTHVTFPEGAHVTDEIQGRNREGHQ